MRRFLPSSFLCQQIEAREKIVITPTKFCSSSLFKARQEGSHASSKDLLKRAEMSQLLWVNRMMIRQITSIRQSTSIICNTSCTKWDSNWMLGKYYSESGQAQEWAAQGRWCNHRPLRSSKNICMLCWEAWFSGKYLWQVDGLGGWS